MINPLQRRWLIGTTLAFFIFLPQAQAQRLSRPDVKPVVNQIAALVEAHYVFPETGRKIAAHLRHEYRRGTFDDIRTWKDFDSVATRSLRQVSHDGHMYVRFDPPTARALQLAPAEQVPESSSQDPFYYGANAAQNNFGFAEVKVLTGNIGYLKLSEINLSERSLPVLYAAMEFVANSQALIIDLRNNGGGGSAVGAVLESYFLPKETPLLEIHGRTGDEVIQTVTWLTHSRYQKQLFILINRATYSAAEALAYVLQAHKRAIIVGQPSGGGANMNSWYPLNEQLFLSVSTSAPTLPGTAQTWEGNGVQPDYRVEEGQQIEFIRKRLSGN